MKKHQQTELQEKLETMRFNMEQLINRVKELQQNCAEVICDVLNVEARPDTPPKPTKGSSPSGAR